jgi:hypothetical protein
MWSDSKNSASFDRIEHSKRLARAGAAWDRQVGDLDG